MAGMSRSATVVLCYLIRAKKMSAIEAIKQLRRHRDVNPSRQQLIYVARMHNRVHGFEGVNVQDKEFPLSELRKLLRKK